MKLFLISAIAAICMVIVGCTNQTESNPPQIAPMSLSAAQQEIVDLITHAGQEILFFEYSGAFNSMEVWVEVYRYGDLVDTFAKLHILSDAQEPIADGQIAITIHNFNRREYRWTITSGGGTVSGPYWAASSDYMARAFGPITEAVSITDGEEILLYISRFTTGSSLNTQGCMQNYIKNPAILAEYTYVHLIKARFLTN